MVRQLAQCQLAAENFDFKLQDKLILGINVALQVEMEENNSDTLKHNIGFWLGPSFRIFFIYMRPY